MSKVATKLVRRNKIHMGIRTHIKGTAERPRLSVFRSNKEIYAQLIDDLTGNTLCSMNSRHKDLAGQKGTKTEIAATVGKALAEKAKSLGIESCVFDRAGYLYHGRVKALADGAREGGLQF